MNHKLKRHPFTLAIILLLLATLTACGQLSVGIETRVPRTPSSQGAEDSPTATSEPPTATPTPESTPEGAQYWTVQQDPGFGFRFAIPCFWRLEFPQDYNQGSGVSYQVYNYPDEFVQTFPRGQGVFENGGIKIDFGTHNLSFDGIPSGISLHDYAYSEMYNNDQSEVVSVEDVTINGQPAVLVTQRNKDTDTTGQFYLLSLRDDVVLLFSAAPAEALSNPDVQGILSSIAIDPQVEVQVPSHVPGAPPVGLAAPCIPQYAEEVIPTQAFGAENTACGLTSYKSLDYLVDTVELYLQNRNTGGLVYENFVRDPIMVADWRTEGAMVTPNEFFSLLANSLYRADQPGGMTFTTDRAQFPDLDGIDPEALIDPQVSISEVVYSTGWGLDGLGEALLYFAQDECSGYYWHGLVFAREGFQASLPAGITISDDLDCAAVTEAAALDWVVCNVQAALRSGNLGALPSFMTDPFAFGYWRSEWISPSPTDAVEELQLYRLPEDKSRLVFTRDRSQFPSLDGQPLEGMLGPDVNVVDVVYSQGWGQDGAGAALLFFIKEPSGRHRFAGVLFAYDHFE